jgi:drug/metabolite transporter (DMT)-like permease
LPRYASPLQSTALLLLFEETFAPWTLLGSALVLLSSIGVLIMDRKARG